MKSLTHLVCPHCQTTNRLPSDQLSQSPNCGQCKAPLFSAKPFEIDSVATFERHLTRNEIPVLVDFWAPWCGPCLAMAPAYLQAAAELEPHVRLLKVNTESLPGLGARFNIRSIPTLMLLTQGQEKVRQAGALSATDIVRWVKSQLR